ncbi:hypothetical protein M8C21_028268 [Ambrosia artemisiifolia]|uniref:Uncharacterized protein n=1 Tax=Ambrosia artemisiifolia TaxID=4212 RepID=A0AAD5DC96_AMBAR|nr:hypothetical protein M8C21_028268 [Ambrosia artemisiifolia]
MAEARDRVSRSNNDDAETYMRRLMSTHSTRIFLDDDNDIYQTPFRWGATPLTGQSSGQRTGEALISTRARNGGGVSTRIQNTQVSGSRVRRGRGGPPWAHGLLPSYPRIPLRDVTHVIRAVERQRVHLGDRELEHEVCLPTPEAAAKLD